MNMGDALNRHVFLRFDRIDAEELLRPSPTQEVLLVRRLVVGVAGRDHHALHARLHQLVEVRSHAVGVGAIEERRVGGHAEARGHRGMHALHRNVIAAFAAHREIVVLALAVHMDREREVLRSA